MGGIFPLDCLSSRRRSRRSSTAASGRHGECGAARPEPPAVLAGPCLTSPASPAGGARRRSWPPLGRVAESMEGAAAAHICALYGVPFLEIAGISNMVADRDGLVGGRAGGRPRRAGRRRSSSVALDESAALRGA